MKKKLKKNFLNLFKTLLGVATFMVTIAVATREIVDYGEIIVHNWFRTLVISSLIGFFLSMLGMYIYFQMIAD